MVFEQEGRILTPSPLGSISYRAGPDEGEKGTERTRQKQVLQSQELPTLPHKEVAKILVPKMPNLVPIPQNAQQKHFMRDTIVPLPPVGTQVSSQPSSKSIELHLDDNLRVEPNTSSRKDEASKTHRVEHEASLSHVGRVTQVDLASPSSPSDPITLRPSRNLASTDAAPRIPPSYKETDRTPQLRDVLGPSVAPIQTSSFGPRPPSPVRPLPLVPVKNISTSPKNQSAKVSKEGFWPLFKDRRHKAEGTTPVPVEPSIAVLDNQTSAIERRGIEMLDGLLTSEASDLTQSEEMAEVDERTTRRSDEVPQPAIEVRQDRVEARAEKQIGRPPAATKNVDILTLEDLSVNEDNQREPDGFGSPQSAKSGIESSTSISNSASEDTALSASEIDWNIGQEIDADESNDEDVEEDEVTSPVTPFLTKAFEGLPFGPDVPAVRIDVTRCFDSNRPRLR